MELVLTNVASEALAKLPQELQDDGYTVLGSEAGDLSDPSLLDRLLAASDERGGLGLPVHTSWTSPTQADWRKVVRVNAVATAAVVNVVEPLLQTDTAAVLIALMAGYNDLRMPETDRLLDEPQAPDLLDRLEPSLKTTGATDPQLFGVAYVLSKRSVIRICEAKAPTWGRRNASIVSLSTELIYKAIGRRERMPIPPYRTAHPFSDGEP